MAGVVGPGQDCKSAERTYVSNLRHAASALAEHGIVGVIEPINKKMGLVPNGPSYTTQGMHGYFLNHTDQARRVIEEVGSPNLLLHLDCYHMQMLEGHLAETIRENIGLLRHVQIAGEVSAGRFLDAGKKRGALARPSEPRNSRGGELRGGGPLSLPPETFPGSGAGT